MTIRCEDWRLSPPDRVAPLLEAETRRWRERLGWDLGDSWAPIEPARASGTLPGLLALDAAGSIRGWTFFLIHRGALQVAALVADAPDITGALVESLGERARAAGASSTIVFAPDEQAPGLADALAAHGFETEPYKYLRASLAGALTAVADAPVALRAWQAFDAQLVARLCERAYRPARDLRPFAPNNRPEEWDEYVAQLVTTLGCGRFMPECSVIAGGEGTALAGAVITTRLDDGTAHLAQVVVDPSAQGRGLGRRLVQAACAAARARAFTNVTLLVASGNRPAVALYESLGFRETARFLAGLAPKHLP